MGFQVIFQFQNRVVPDTDSTEESSGFQAPTKSPQCSKNPTPKVVNPTPQDPINPWEAGSFREQAPKGQMPQPWNTAACTAAEEAAVRSAGPGEGFSRPRYDSK